MTVTAPATLRLAIRVITALWAAAEKPSPPYSPGMIMPKKPCYFMKSQTAGGRSPFRWASQSSIIRQSSTTGPSRKARSSGFRARGSKPTSFGPARASREEIAVPPHRARLQGELFGVADPGEIAGHEAHQGRGHEALAEGGDAEEDRHGHEDRRHDPEQERKVAAHPPHHEPERHRDRPGGKRPAPVEEEAPRRRHHDQDDEPHSRLPRIAGSARRPRGRPEPPPPSP